METPPDTTSLDAAQAKAKPYRIAVGQGLYLEVTPTGSKLWRMKYRFDGKEKRLALGTFPAVSLEQASQARDEARAMLKAGTDPAAVRRAARAWHTPSPASAFRLELTQDNALTIETPGQALRLTPEQTAAVRAFLLAAEPESTAHAPD